MKKQVLPLLIATVFALYGNSLYAQNDQGNQDNHGDKKDKNSQNEQGNQNDNDQG